MSETQETYNQLLAHVTPPESIQGVDTWSHQYIEAREALFEAVRRALEPRIYPRALAIGLETIRTEARPIVSGTIDTWDELTVTWSRYRHIPIAYALHTLEKGQDTVRFGVYPLGRIGRLALGNLNKIDDTLEGFIGY